MKIRNYTPQDQNSCRDLWKTLTHHHRDIYQNQSIGGEHPENIFDEHLEKVGPDNLWVTEIDDQVIGLIGLEKSNEDWFIEPIIVASNHQNKGVGKFMIEFIIKKAKKYGYNSLSVKPVVRNRKAVKFFYEQGFNKIGHIELFINFQEKSKTKWKSGLEIFNLNFEY